MSPKHTKVTGKEDELEDKKLAHFKSPPKDSKEHDTKIGEETPPATTEGYDEENVVPNPADKPNKS